MFAAFTMLVPEGIKQMPMVVNIIITFNGVMFGSQAASLCCLKSSFGGRFTLGSSSAILSGKTELFEMEIVENQIKVIFLMF